MTSQEEDQKFNVEEFTLQIEQIEKERHQQHLKDKENQARLEEEALMQRRVQIDRFIQEHHARILEGLRLKDQYPLKPGDPLHKAMISERGYLNEKYRLDIGTYSGMLRLVEKNVHRRLM